MEEPDHQDVMWLRTWRTGSNEAKTHLLLDGGKLAVPDESHETFLNAYANAVCRGETVAVVEVKPPVFRLFADLDFPGVKDDVLFEVVRAMWEVARDLFVAGERLTLHVLESARPDKRGVHVVFPAVFVTADTAKTFRLLVLDALAMTDVRHQDLDMAKVFDACVYGNTGLRMPWSVKGVGMTLVYAPVWSYDGLDKVDIPAPQIAADYRRLVRETCIRTLQRQETPTTFKMLRQTPAGHTASASRSRVSSDLLQRLVAAMPVQFLGSHVTHTYAVGSSVILKSTSRVCGNLGFRAHNSNTVYFVIDKEGHVRQKCYCRCDTTHKRLHGYCRDYASPPLDVPPEVVKAIQEAVFSLDFVPEGRQTTAAPKHAGSELDALLARSRPALKKKRTKRS